MAKLPIQIPSKQRKKLIQSLETYSPMHARYNVPYGVPSFIQQAYPNGRFTPMSNKSKLYDKTAGDKMCSVIGMPSRAIPLTLSMSSSFDPENGLMRTNSNGEIDQVLHLAPIYDTSDNDNMSYKSNNSSSSSNSDLFGNNNNMRLPNFNNKTHTYVRSSVSMSNLNSANNNNSSHSIQRRFSNFVPPSFSSNKVDLGSLDKFGKKTKQRLSSITGGARKSIMVSCYCLYSIYFILYNGSYKRLNLSLCICFFRRLKTKH